TVACANGICDRLRDAHCKTVTPFTELNDHATPPGSRYLVYTCARRGRQGECGAAEADTIIRLHIAPVPSARPRRGNTGSNPRRCADPLFGLAAGATVPA